MLFNKQLYQQVSLFLIIVVCLFSTVTYLRSSSKIVVNSSPSTSVTKPKKETSTPVYQEINYADVDPVQINDALGLVEKFSVTSETTTTNTKTLEESILPIVYEGSKDIKQMRQNFDSAVKNIQTYLPQDNLIFKNPPEFKISKLFFYSQKLDLRHANFAELKNLKIVEYNQDNDAITKKIRKNKKIETGLESNSNQPVSMSSKDVSTALDISSDKQKELDAEITQEKQDADDHNTKIRQYYTESELQSIEESKGFIKGNDENNTKYFAGREVDQATKLKEKQNKIAFESLNPFNTIDAEAGYLNNSSNNLLIYPRMNTGLAVDLTNGNGGNGNQLQLAGRHGAWEQRLTFFDQSGEIKIVGKCLDIRGGNISAGTPVQIYDCNGTVSQKWVVFDGQIKPVVNTSLCLDAAQGLNGGSKMTIWTCHGGDNQNWRIGDNDFARTDFYLNIYAANTNIYFNNGLQGQGHALTSLQRGYGSNANFNSFTSWPGDDSNDTNLWGRTNNIKTNNSIYIDKDEDWDVSLTWDNPNTRNMAFRGKWVTIPKSTYDFIKYSNGYKNLGSRLED